MNSPRLNEEENDVPRVVPMPVWSSALGCLKLVFSIIILAFVAACTAVWGGCPAFVFTLITACFTLLTFTYYLSALSYRPQLYNCYAVLALEAQGTIYWMISMILLARWTSNSNYRGSQQYGSDIPRSELSPIAVLSARKWSLAIRGADSDIGPQYNAALKLAGISAGLTGLEFALFLVTITVFTINLRRHGRPKERTSRDYHPSKPDVEDPALDGNQDKFNPESKDITRYESLDRSRMDNIKQSLKSKSLSNTPHLTSTS